MLSTDTLLHIGLGHYIFLSGILFSFGMIAVLMRKNVIVMLMGIELMLNAVNLSFIAFSRESGNLNDHRRCRGRRGACAGRRHLQKIS